MQMARTTCSYQQERDLVSLSNAGRAIQSSTRDCILRSSPSRLHSAFVFGGSKTNSKQETLRAVECHTICRHQKCSNFMETAEPDRWPQHTYKASLPGMRLFLRNRMFSHGPTTVNQVKRSNQLSGRFVVWDAKSTCDHRREGFNWPPAAQR